MQVRLLRDCDGPNPDYDWSRPRSEQDAAPTRTLPKGTVLESPDAFHLVRAGLAEPHDDEARENHARHLEWKRRKLDQRAAAVAARRSEARVVEDDEEDTDGRETAHA